MQLIVRNGNGVQTSALGTSKVVAWIQNGQTALPNPATASLGGLMPWLAVS